MRWSLPRFHTQFEAIKVTSKYSLHVWLLTENYLLTECSIRCVHDLVVLGFCGHHYNDIIMNAMVSQITSLTIVCSTIESSADQRKHQSSWSLAFVRGIHQWSVNSLHKGPVTQKMFPFDYIIMYYQLLVDSCELFTPILQGCFTGAGAVIYDANYQLPKGASSWINLSLILSFTTTNIDSLAPGRFEGNFRSVIFKPILSDWYLRYSLRNCHHLNVTGPYLWKVNIGSGNGLVPSGSKPLPELMLTQFYDAIWGH